MVGNVLKEDVAMFSQYFCRECFLIFEVISDQEVEFCPDCDNLADRFDDLPKREY
jgi:rRNA maturation endonuclease Nob1